MPKWMLSRKSELLKPMLLGLTLMLSTPILTGCAKMMATLAIDTSCKAFRPITWSHSDTDQTIKEVKAHNAVYDKLCPVAVTAPK